MLPSSPSATWPVKVSGRCSWDVLPVQQIMFDGFQMHQGEVVLHEPEQLHLTFVVGMVDDKQVNGVVWSGTSGESLNKGTVWSEDCWNNNNNKTSEVPYQRSRTSYRHTHITRNKQQTDWVGTIKKWNMALNVRTLNWIQNWTGSQWSCWTTGVMWRRFE